jgi:hypothetical protein
MQIYHSNRLTYFVAMHSKLFANKSQLPKMHMPIVITSLVLTPSMYMSMGVAPLITCMSICECPKKGINFIFCYYIYI